MNVCIIRCNNVVLDTTKVQIFKQITTGIDKLTRNKRLFQIPQRYRFSSKSQRHCLDLCQRWVVLDTTKVQIFKQITTAWDRHILYLWLFQIPQRYRFSSKSQHINTHLYRHFSCFRYHKGTDFQANHNPVRAKGHYIGVVLDTTKVQIFKQITTYDNGGYADSTLFQIPQRYRFSSKSQLILPFHSNSPRCFRYHKGTDFQANHNDISPFKMLRLVVLDTTKVQIFKQITTRGNKYTIAVRLFQIPQRYRFSSKSQHVVKRRLSA